MERLPLLVGRARTIEIALGADDFDAEMAERYGWINRAIPDADLDGFVANYVRRVLSFDQRALSAAKAAINQAGLPDEGKLQATQEVFSATLRWPSALERLSKSRARGIGVAGDFELKRQSTRALGFESSFGQDRLVPIHTLYLYRGCGLAPVWWRVLILGSCGAE